MLKALLEENIEEQPYEENSKEGFPKPGTKKKKKSKTERVRYYI